MPTNVVMPQMGESVAEGTIVRWIKKIGEAVDRDEPLFEISTDKVDAEIPSPVAGTLSAILVTEGQTVPIDTVVATIAQAGESAAAGASAASGASGAASSPANASAGTAGSAHNGRAAASSADGTGFSADGAAATGTSGTSGGTGTSGTSGRAGTADAAGVSSTSGLVSGASGTPGTSAMPGTSGTPRAEMSRDELRRHRSSPLVRRIAQEHNVDISQIPGSGISGRVTKQDILKFIESAPAGGHQPPQAPGSAAGAAARGAQPGHILAYAPGERVEVVPMSVMRKRIAEHMVISRRTSAHVHSVFEVDFSHVSKIRAAKKDEYERAGTKLTFLSFIAKATVDALRASPVLNAAIDGDAIVYKKDINLGIAVALDWGLIVPVIKHADERNLLGLTRAVADLAARARTKQLKPEEVQGGTFTITNPGIFGAQFGMPIINQPQVAILGIGAIEKRVAVVDDAIAIRLKGYLTLGYDHRLVDGAVADEFMSLVKQKIETFDPASV